jgi:uncharacterized DUF497 family protein
MMFEWDKQKNNSNIIRRNIDFNNIKKLWDNETIKNIDYKHSIL